MYKYRIASYSKCFATLLLLALLSNVVVVTYIGLRNNEIDFSLSKSNLGKLKEYYFSNVLYITRLEEDLYTDSRNRFIQENAITCGPAAARYLLNYFGVSISEAELSNMMDVTPDGVSLYEIKKTLEQYGLESNGLVINFPKLKEVKKPVIALINNNHYVLIRKITNKYVYLFDPDPSRGFIKVNHNNFFNIWDGVILKVNTKPIFQGDY